MTFSDIAVLATSIYRDYFNSPKNSDLPIKIISSDGSDKTFHDYITTAAKTRGINKVELFSVDYRYNFIRGRFQMFKTEASVLISNTQNSCWSRYVAAKELSHIVVDKTKESMTVNIDRTLDWMLTNMDTNIHESLDSEHIAAQFAVEILVPYDLSHDLLKKDRSEISSWTIASMFKVPERIIDVLRQPHYIALRDEAYKDL